MYEIGNWVRSVDKMAKRGIGVSCYLIQYPSGRWGFAGFGVPIDLAYIDPTPEKLEAAKSGGRFGPQTRAFDTEQDGIEAAQSLGLIRQSNGMWTE